MNTYIRYIISYLLLNNVDNQHLQDPEYNERLTKLTDDISKGDKSKYIYTPLIEVQRIISKNLLRDLLLVSVFGICSLFVMYQSFIISDWSVLAFSASVAILILHLFNSRVKICVRIGSAYFYAILKLKKA